MNKRGIENSTRQKILESLKEPKTVSQLALEFKDEISSPGTLTYHLKKLRDSGLVSFSKDQKKQGRPTVYFHKDKSISRFAGKSLDEINKMVDEQREKVILNTLNYLNRDKNSGVSIRQIIKDLNLKTEDEKSRVLNIFFEFVVGDGEKPIYAEQYFKITKEGEYYLKEHGKS